MMQIRPTNEQTKAAIRLAQKQVTGSVFVIEK
jgi:hypothetical protein